VSVVVAPVRLAADAPRVPSAAMDPRDEAPTLARRELVLVAVVLVAMARLVDGPDAFLLAGLIPIVILLAGAGLFAGSAPTGRRLEGLLIPATLAGGAAAAIHLVPVGLGLVPALGALALLMDRILLLEQRLLGQSTGTSEADRSRVLLAAVVTAFIAFTGISALVPGAFAQAGTTADPLDQALSEVWLIVLAIDDAIVALLLGYRVAVLRYASAGEAARSALTYAIVVAVAAGAVRAIDLPRLVGPAVLTLVFYLWDALHGTAPARRREPRFVWETVLLVALAVVVVAWNLRLRV
jgi:hypothetical protein